MPEFVSWLPFGVTVFGTVSFLAPLLELERFAGGMVHERGLYLCVLFLLMLGVLLGVVLHSFEGVVRRRVEGGDYAFFVRLSAYGAIPILLRLGIAEYVSESAILAAYIFGVGCALLGIAEILKEGFNPFAGSLFLRRLLVVGATVAGLLASAGLLEQSPPNHLSPDPGEALLFGGTLLFLSVLLPFGGWHLAGIIAEEKAPSVYSRVNRVFFLIACVVPIAMYVTERMMYLGWLFWYIIPLASAASIVPLACCESVWKRIQKK